MARIVLAGGGTAGHTSPLIATAQRLTELDPGADLLVIGTPKGLENTVIPAAGLRLELVEPVPLPRRPNKDLFTLPVRLGRSVRAAKKILTDHRADVLVGFGGYVSVPAYLAARSLKVPIVVHEGNSVPGIANKLGARFTTDVVITFPGTPLRHAQHLGLPLRRTITDAAGLDAGARAAVRAEARAEYGLHPDLPLLLVSGGSQGARSINTAVSAAATEGLLAGGIQVLHVLGAKNFTEQHVRIEDPSGAVYQPVPYVDAMERAYLAADLMVGRSGAGTVVETAVIGLPTILVPLPHGNGEQGRNAAPLVDAGGARLVDDADCTPELLGRLVPELINDPQTLARMRAAGQGLMPADADLRLAEMVLAAVR
ncbi:UDP-N-acetylglucosamine--N-acetylmuramyl-(pentapeptide) pyrophosphoryl-undecaprenol N-acetylglucosamine transferase [Enemella sp. A6]|uniref:UDP-N-acetylglucosamine--N-acetylmuramyl- (pentapeptide) pyrophosphoryl-undecaprenol N-acetylglucosamine transferase n=1 Tax=Enemella sp. A6 TaxID=3440152 RepID=UPI003EBA6443